MVDRFAIRLTKEDGAPIAVKQFGPGGLVLRGDGDAWPRGAILEFYPTADVTRMQIAQVRQAQSISEYHLAPFKATDGALGFRGPARNSIPAGFYRIRLRATQLTLPVAFRNIEIKQAGPNVFDLPVTSDPRQVVLAPGLTDPEFDHRIKHLVSAAGPPGHEDLVRLDGAPIPAWLQDPHVNAERRACVLNLAAKLRAIDSPDRPLIEDVNYVFFVDFERMYVGVKSSFRPHLDALTTASEFYCEGFPVDSETHLRLVTRVRDAGLEPPDAGFTLTSYRQEGDDCMQAVVAQFASGNCYADLDIDLGNPLQDIRGFFIHMSELGDPVGLTDHLSLHDQLAAQTGTKNYLQYQVV